MTQPAKDMKDMLTWQIAAVMVMVAGRGWAAGYFAPGTPWWSYLVLSIPVALPLALGLGLLRATAKRAWFAIGLHIYAGLSLALAIGSIAAGVGAAHLPDFGVSTPPEIVPTAIIAAGALMWLVTLLPVRHAARPTSVGSTTSVVTAATPRG